MTDFRWGILGTGGMARVHVEAIRNVPGCDVVAVGGREAERTAAFAGDHTIESWYPSYQALIDEADLDAVYVATTNELHLPLVVAAVGAGIPVLCEKPFAINLGQSVEMVAAARAAGVFLMEAMWMSFQPALLDVERRVAAGEIGTLLQISADICHPVPRDPERRWFDPQQGGGTLIDMGVYPLTLATELLGEPRSVSAEAVFADTGVDEQLGFTTRHRDGAVAVLGASFSSDLAFEAVIAGTHGRLRMHRQFINATRVTLERGTEVVETADFAPTGTGYEGQVAEVVRCVRAGLTESDRRPLDSTLTVMRWLDEIRRQIGLRYPGE